MYKIFILLSLVALSLGQPIENHEPATDVEQVPLPTDDFEPFDAAPVAPIDETVPVEPLTAETIFGRSPDTPVEGSIDIREPLPVEIAQPGLVSETGSQLDKEVIDYAAPSASLDSPTIDLPKGALEVVDVPHANIELPGNSIVNQDVLLNLPSPVIEAPRPIIRPKEVIFRVPQPIFYVPRPVIQHKPIIYRLGHTLRAITPIVSIRPYAFRVPQAQITGKSAYTQPIPHAYKGKSIL